ncbi:MAG: hypothetical protein J6B01_04465 [Ruminococcus sp.]|nr:hypothetical protein [Ruminococcus sp.]
MKIGDVVFSTKIRPYDLATITDVQVMTKEKQLKDGRKKKEVRTTYTAQFNDGTFMKFYGFNIDKTIFKHTAPDGQLTLDAFMDMSG